MMYSQNKAAQYRSITSHGLVADASPTRLVQISLESILTHLATAKGCMERIRNNVPLADVVTKGNAIGKAIRLISHLNDSLDLKQGGEVAANLRNLYLYMLERLTQANVTNDTQIVSEVSDLVRKVKGGWDQIVTSKP
ncbi:MAG: flagellar export chaperone FliS [Steroidobacterales bacterium]